jgi:hypothetical protein
MDALRQLICAHIENSLSDKQFKEELSFSIPAETVRRVKGILFFDMSGYMCVIRANEVRHVKRRHPNDVDFICEIPEIIQHFHSVKKSITTDSKTGASLINLEFYKNYDKKNVKLVKLKIHREKRLELKTIFVEEQ